MHHDPLLSTRANPFFHWGHVWVVLAVIIHVPGWKKSFALPVLAKLYRTKKSCDRDKRTFHKKTELASQLIALLAQQVPDRQVTVLADAAYANASILRPLPPNVHFIGRSRLDAALYSQPEPHSRGRPRVKGFRLPTPAARAKAPRGWTSLALDVYGKHVTVQVEVFDALWRIAARGRLLRFVLVHGWPGHQHDDVLVSTDLQRDAPQIITDFCQRWNIEVTFHELKDKLGFEEPQNRTHRAVERTAPMAFWLYSLTVAWYLLSGKDSSSASLASTPWYSKPAPAFSDMLAALRRETWRARLLDPASTSPDSQKSMAPLLDALAYAA